MYEIFSDMNLDIDASVAAANNLRFVPMQFHVGDDVITMSELPSWETMHQFYDRLRNKELTSTSQINPFLYAEVFEPYVKEGKGVFYLSISSGLSNTYNSACMAKEQLLEKYPDAEIEIVDSMGATGGMGLLLESAFRNRAAGMSVSENAEWVRAHALNVIYWVKVEDLMYLKRGGRISAASAVMGTALNIKPVLRINAEGKLDIVAKKRGKKQAMEYLLEQYSEMRDPSIPGPVYICSADCVADAEILRQMVLEAFPGTEVRLTTLSPVIGSHTGADMLSLIHYGNPAARSL